MGKQIAINHRKREPEYFIVSDEDYEWASQFKWFTIPAGYVFRKHRKREGYPHNAATPIHRELMTRLGYDLTGMVIDHIDHDPRNNQRDNLRVCTHAQNVAAGRTQTRKGKKKSRYRGVYWNSPIKKWQVSVRVDGKNQHVGVYVNEDDAARAYNVAALKQWGEFAVLNDVPVIQYELPFAA